MSQLSLIQGATQADKPTTMGAISKAREEIGSVEVQNKEGGDDESDEGNNAGEDNNVGEEGSRNKGRSRKGGGGEDSSTKVSTEKASTGWGATNARSGQHPPAEQKIAVERVGKEEEHSRKDSHGDLD